MTLERQLNLGPESFALHPGQSDEQLAAELNIRVAFDPDERWEQAIHKPKTHDTRTTERRKETRRG